MNRHPHLHEHETILEVKHLTVAYGKVEALHDISLTIRRGEIVTVIGPNGAGKTTLLAALMGLLPSRGEIIYMGQSQWHERSVEHLVRHGMTLVPEKRELFAEMSVQDNLRLGGFDRWRRGARDLDATLADVYGLFPRLKEREGQQAGTLSGGERQMLAVGRALMAKPRLLMLDEPVEGLAPVIVEEIVSQLKTIKAAGVTILLVEQNLEVCTQLADRHYIIEQGAIVHEASNADFLADAAVKDRYLGVGLV